MKSLILILSVSLLTSSLSFAGETRINRRAFLMSTVAASTNIFLYNSDKESTLETRLGKSMIFPVVYSIAEGDAKLGLANIASSMVGVVLSEIFMREVWFDVDEDCKKAVVGVKVAF